MAEDRFNEEFSGRQPESVPGRKKKKKGSIWLKILIVILSLILAVMIVLAVGLEYILGRLGEFEEVPEGTKMSDEFDTDETLEGAGTLITIDPDDVTQDTAEVLQGDMINIMLIGQDRREGEDRGRSDSMILITLNRAKNTIQMTSFMRDTYVQIPGYKNNKLNVAYRYGGTQLMNETFLVNFGVEIDGNVMVDFEEFSNIINILGGVDIEMSDAEARYMRNKGHSGITSGKNHLDGEAALTYARMRYISGDDFGRTERQRKVLGALMESFRGADLVTLVNLVNEVVPHVVTNLSYTEIVECVTEGVTMLASGAQIQSMRIPADDAYYNASVNGMSVLMPDYDKCWEDLEEFIYSTEE